MAPGSAGGGRSAPRVCEPLERQTRAQVEYRLNDTPRRGKEPKNVRRDILQRRRKTPPNDAAVGPPRTTRVESRLVPHAGPWRNQTTRSSNCPERSRALSPVRHL